MGAEAGVRVVVLGLAGRLPFAHLHGAGAGVADWHSGI